jgi:hypothetical protein
MFSTVRVTRDNPESTRRQESKHRRKQGET